MARGEVTAAVAWLEVGGDGGPDAIETTARPASGDHVILAGKKRFVVDGHTADLLLVAARAPATRGDDGVALYAVPAGAAGVRRRRLPTMDATRALAEVVLADVRVPASSRLGAGGWPAIARAIALGRIALAAEQVGGAEACLELAVDYAKVRHQFGRPIGSFQAIKHKFVDMMVALERARSLGYFAALTIAEDDPRRSSATSVAKAAAGDCQKLLAKEGIQIHGGIGYTWEHDMQLFVRRIKSGEPLFGSSTWHRARIAELLGV